jgi:hypothetical protein
MNYVYYSKFEGERLSENAVVEIMQLRSAF